ncbi:hypothetical protein A0U94_06495 [Gluconobacter albidus]|uniref:hypothetical protein n=1 Tax=Gluconobacter albidus TaxID=318683 RepID=UPI000989B582|nr:hypothetical protein [Gluconobacter albidus]AQS90673.1 hypothetical protein A0U94_06495 [Gluconobacter albidus]
MSHIQAHTGRPATRPALFDRPAPQTRSGFEQLLTEINPSVHAAARELFVNQQNCRNQAGILDSYRDYDGARIWSENAFQIGERLDELLSENLIRDPVPGIPEKTVECRPVTTSAIEEIDRARMHDWCWKMVDVLRAAAYGQS